MKTTGRNLLLAIAFFGLLTTNQTVCAGDFGRSLMGQLKQAARHELARSIDHTLPRCSNPHKPCPLPQPYPIPQPTCRYFLGVWTTLVELVSPEGHSVQPLAHDYAAVGSHVPTTHQGPTYGLRVDRTVEHSPACRAGLEPNDVLLLANGCPLQSKHDLTTAIHNSRGQLRLVVLDGRTGEVVALTVSLSRR